MSPDVFSASPPERNRFSGSFLVVYSPDEFQTYLSLKNVLSRIAPYVELDACQSTGTLEEFTVTRRADNVVVFDSQSGDNTRLRQGMGRIPVNAFLSVCSDVRGSALQFYLILPHTCVLRMNAELAAVRGKTFHEGGRLRVSSSSLLLSANTLPRSLVHSSSLPKVFV